MKVKQNNKLNMFNALTLVMDSNKKIWSRVKEIEKAYKSFLDGNNRLNILKEDHEKSLQQLIDKKSDARKNLILESIPVANVIIAFSNENKQKELAKKSNFSKNELKKSKDLDLVEHSKTIWREAKKLYNKSIATSESVKSKDKENAFNIHNYGLTGQMIDKLEIANVAFIEAHLELKDAILHKKKCSNKITSIIKANSRILKSKLDLLMSLFKISDPTFYKKYLEARKAHKASKTKTVRADNKKAVHTSETKIEETIPVIKEVSAIKVVPKRRSRANPVVKKPIVSEPVKTVTEASKSSIVKPEVKKTVVSRSTLKKPIARKPVVTSKATENKTVTDETVK